MVDVVSLSNLSHVLERVAFLVLVEFLSPFVWPQELTSNMFESFMESAQLFGEQLGRLVEQPMDIQQLE